MTQKSSDEDTLPPGTVLVDPTKETGVRPVQTRMPGDDAATLKEILKRVIGFSDVAEANRETLHKISSENVRIGATLDTVRTDNGKLLKQNTELLDQNRKLFHEVQQYRYKLERRTEDLERRVWNLEGRVDKLEGTPDADRPTPDPPQSDR